MACINSTFQSCSIARGAKISTRASRGSSGGKGSPTFQCKASTFVNAASLRLELDENPEAIISRVWPENVSLLSYDDLRAYLESQETVQVEDDQHVALLGEAMSTPVLMATADQTLEEVECHFEAVSGLPVVDSSLRCVGVVVKNDRARASHGVSSLFPSLTHTNTSSC
ncbi:hypothetical protein BDA96_04G370400 [Sorghum bicolor]|uniref:CBS domain-containing protein n=1 Tax=Sorghum bicolor TaxID=4558 RepID=A0A921R9B8_SORBI|nr:hypothetical protein BDA96_04G370400 [Sorghum bicolor]